MLILMLQTFIREVVFVPGDLCQAPIPIVGNIYEGH